MRRHALPSGRSKLARGLVLLGLTAAACGKRGAPEPPLPSGPHPPGRVSARQIGHRAVVGFDAPAPRGSRPSQQLVRAELVRVTYPPGHEPPPDPDAFRRRGEVVGQIASEGLSTGGRLYVEDITLGRLAEGGTGSTLRYALRAFDRRGRRSPLVVAQDLEPLTSPGPPRELVVEPTADGVRLSWQPPEAEPSFPYNVYRARPDAPWPDEPLNSEPLAALEYLDTQVVTGETYLYSVRTSLAPGVPRREGEPSASREVVAEDRFAPRAPANLVAVQEGHAVRLFWDPNPERDVAGYRVERSVDGGAWVPAVAVLSATPSFLDADVVVGRRQSYRVVAVDRASPPNESEPSTAVEVEIVAEPVAPGPAAP